jgi:hypothetical protein
LMRLPVERGGGPLQGPAPLTASIHTAATMSILVALDPDQTQKET